MGPRNNNNLMLVNSDNSVIFASQFAPPADWSDVDGAEHFVQFYENDAFLVRSVGAYIGTGLSAGNAAIVIATQAHRNALEEYLQAHGLDLAALHVRGQYFPMDAAETLAKFMVDGSPDHDLFIKVIGDRIAQATSGRRGVYAFGEMVALLWAEGNAAAAIRLEELWNELGKRHCFSLFCAYPMDGFRGASNGQPLMHICKEHARVIPAESYAAQINADERLRAIALLQQKAGSLEMEIAEREHAEAALRKKQTKLDIAVAVAQLGIWELDVDTQSIACSERCKAHFGLAPDDSLTYERAFELIHPEDRETVRNALSTAIEAGTDYNTEFRVIDPSGRLRWIAAMGRCLHTGDTRMLGTTLDITERKRAAEILEQTVVERTAELHETIAELESFSYSVSHDMRAPLRSMQGYAHILMQECGAQISAECRTYLERITSATGRMDQLIQDVLTFSRVARADFDLEPVSLDALVRDILDSYPNLQAPHAHITVEGHLPPVLGNEAALTQCLSNLLGNAVKFVAPGTRPQVRIWAEPRVDAQTSWVRLAIQDNGIGIPKDAHEKIFEMFQRLSKNYEGTGIGLAIVKKSATRMGGRVGLESEPGQGSTFWVELRHANSVIDAV